MKTEDFNYDLPERHIAQNRIKPFDQSKLLVLDKASGKIENRIFKDIIDYLNKNDVIVFNNTKVFKARLQGKKLTGGNIEILLLEPIINGKSRYNSLIKGNVKVGSKIIINDELSLQVLELLPNGDRLIEFSSLNIDLEKEIDKVAMFPIPSYISNQDEQYQTVYADSSKAMSIAAPTAGFHFTDELLNKIKDKNIQIENITLNVGIGTFRPVKVEEIKDHIMHYEKYNIDEETLNRLNKYKQEGKRIIAVGTTSVRTLEDSSNEYGVLEKMNNDTNLFITPGYKFKFVDAIITNFHLPKSTLLMLVASFAGKDNIMSAYQHAIKNNYRFYSFGDAMFIK